jgi:hypothetical protein
MTAAVVNVSTLNVTESIGTTNGNTSAGGQSLTGVDSGVSTPVIGTATQTVTQPSATPKQAAPTLVGSGDPAGGSFVSLAAGAPGAGSAAGSSTDQPAAQTQSSKSSGKTSPAPTINWDTQIDVTGSLASSTVTSPTWVDDFLNHLGQSETQRNPNAAIKVRPTSAGVAGHA